jgi:cytochrome b involved in lipid metabolism
MCTHVSPNSLQTHLKFPFPFKSSSSSTEKKTKGTHAFSTLLQPLNFASCIFCHGLACDSCPANLSTHSSHPPRSVAMSRDRIITAGAVEDLIADGRKIVIFEDYVLQLDSWLEKHPGGALAILHMVGKDATDEINA